ncbi:hypothetical protein [Thalassobacillus sp. B23F22_16]|uniref:hypothetical protein n=1 Tax=Thalassobacillus sp. B23F22_16 TaxID=3459513 RepID=UPI00373F730B
MMFFRAMIIIGALGVIVGPVIFTFTDTTKKDDKTKRIKKTYRYMIAIGAIMVLIGSIFAN